MATVSSVLGHGRISNFSVVNISFFYDQNQERFGGGKRYDTFRKSTTANGRSCEARNPIGFSTILAICYDHQNQYQHRVSMWFQRSGTSEQFLKIVYQRQKVISIQAPQYRPYALISNFLDLEPFWLNLPFLSNGALLSRVAEGSKWSFASSKPRFFMPRKGWSTVQVPDAWLQLIKGPRPPSTKWPVRDRQSSKSPAKGCQGSQVTSQPEANRRGPLPEEVVSVARARVGKIGGRNGSSGRDGPHFWAFTRGTEDSEGPMPSPPCG